MQKKGEVDKWKVQLKMINNVAIKSVVLHWFASILNLGVVLNEASNTYLISLNNCQKEHTKEEEKINN